MQATVCADKKFTVVCFITRACSDGNLLLILLLLRFNPYQIFIILLELIRFLCRLRCLFFVNSQLFLLTFLLIFIRLIKLFYKKYIRDSRVGLKFTSKLDMIGRIDIEEN